MGAQIGAGGFHQCRRMRLVAIRRLQRRHFADGKPRRLEIDKGSVLVEKYALDARKIIHFFSRRR